MEPNDLYGLPLEQFTDRRNVLARELRRDGERERAAAVSKLRKPSVAAWAVNQLVRTQKREVDALFKSGDALRQAQADVLAGSGDAAALRASVQAEREAVERLLAAARGLLNSDGHELTRATLEQVSDTLHAAALDHEARATVDNGCLERELRHVGLGELAASSAEPARKRQSSREDRAAERSSRGATAERRRAARQAEAAARRQLDAAGRQLQDAEQRRQRAAADLRDAEEALAAAREVASRAEEEHRQATKRLEES